MFRKTIAVILLITLIFSLAGCKDDQPDPSVDPLSPDMTDPIEILDLSGNKLGEIPSDSNCTAYDGGIFYSTSHNQNIGFTRDKEYYLFTKTDNKSHLITTVKDQGYETTFCRTELNGKIYTLVLIGYPFDEKADTLNLLVVDTVKMNSTIIKISDDGFPYDYLAEANGNILIMNHETNSSKQDKIYEFDPQTNKLTEKISIPSDADSYRAVCEYKNGFCLFRVHQNENSNPEMFLDFYDMQFNFSESILFSDLVMPAILEMQGMTGVQDALTELSMYISHLSVSDDRYLYYENSGVIRFVFDLQSRKVILKENDLYTVSCGSGYPVIYKFMYNDDLTSAPDIIEIRNGEPVSVPLNPVDGTHKYLTTLSHSPSGTWTALMIDGYPLSMASQQLLLWSD